MNKTNDPVIEYSERGYSVALSNHADFTGTLDYVAATGAKESPVIPPRIEICAAGVL